MAVFTGTAGAESIYPSYVSPTVDADPAGSRPGSLSDTIYANGGSDYIEASGGDDFIYSGAGNDTAYGGAGNDFFDDFSDASFGGSDTFYGGAGNDTLYGYTGDDALYGDDGADWLYGEDGWDTLNGGIGADRMFGGLGGDTYYVDNVFDYVEEVSGSAGGYDSVQSSVNFTLGDHVETLTLVGRSAIDGTGNALANSLTGNGAANVLLGLGGSDSLSGLGGTDRLEGGDGNDSLDGGAGGDLLFGGAGDDTYHLDEDDQAFESAGGGIDSVFADASWTLGANFENLYLGYSGDAWNGTGNSAANSIFGNYGNNTLRGLEGNDRLYGEDGHDSLYGDAGADQLYGGWGNDTYYLDNLGDRITEYGGAGFDTVYSSVSHTLGANVETLRMIPGSGAVSVTGNGLDNELWATSERNTIRGLGGADRIDSGNGADTVFGGLGNDSFIYVSAVPSNPAARDTIQAGDGAVAFEKAGSALGDRFDLSKFDANSLVSGVQDFVFGLATGIGRLWAVNSGTTTLIRGNTDADAAAEFEVAIADGGVLASAYTTHDFIV